MPDLLPRIALISDSMYGRPAGTGYACARLVEGLRRDHADSVRLIEVVRRAAQAGTGAVCLGHPLAGRSVYSWYPHVARTIGPGHCDLLHNPGQVPTYFRPRVPYVITVHDLIPLLYPETSRRGRPTIYRLLYGRTLASAAAVFASSQNTKQDIQRLFGVDEARITVVPLGVSERYRPAGSEADRAADAAILARLSIQGPYILYVGTLEGRKGLETLVDAFRVLLARGYPHRLVLAGARGWKTEALDGALARLPRPERVLITGYVPQEDLPTLYRRASVFAFPSRYEGFGLPPLEAMASGTPVVAAATSSIPEVVGDAALLFGSGDATTLAEQMGQILDDPERAARMREAGLAQAARFTWSACVERTLAGYMGVLGRC